MRTPLKILIALLIAFLVISLFGGGGLGILVHSASLLAVGWAKFLIRVVPDAEPNWPLAASGMVAALASGWLLHRLAQRLAPEVAWSARQTVAVMACLLALFAAAVCGTGIVHQFGWLVRGPVLENEARHPVTKESNKLRQLYVGVRLYAADYDGRYPENLELLLKERIVERYVELGLATDVDGEQTEPAAYFGAGLKDTDPPDLIVVASPRPAFSKNRRLVATNDGAVELMAEDEFQERLAKQKKYYARPTPSG